jgi:translation elongation factor EF-G
MHLLSIAITPKTTADQEKLAAGLQTLTTEDQTLLQVRLARIGNTTRLQFNIATSSEQQLELIIDRLTREFHVEATLGPLQIACPHDLEPVMLVEVVTPEEHIGDIIGDLNRRRGRIVALSEHDRMTEIDAHVPLADLLGYATSLQQLTRSRATHRITFDHYRSRDHGPDASDDDRTSHVGAPRRPSGPHNVSAIALPEPDDDPHDHDTYSHRPFYR